MNVILLGVLGYVLVQVVIGLVVSRRIKTEDDYLLAGRSLGYGMAVFSIFATWFGAESCIGSAGSIYTNGLEGGSADPFGYGLCLIFMGVFFAAALWKEKLVTLADLLRKRFGQNVERIAVLMMVPTSVMWAAAQIRAFGQVLSASSELDVTLAITIAATVVLIYTVSGGFLADAITDFVQGIILILGLALVFATMVNGLGGFQATFAMIDPDRLSFFSTPGVSLLGRIEIWAVPICGSVVAQELVARVSASRSATVARRSSLIAGGMYLLLGLIPVSIGLLGPQIFAGLTNAEQILPLVAQKYLPTFLYIVFAGALVSAILSTVDSALLVASSLVAHNLVMPLRKNLTEKRKVLITRLWVVAFGVLAYVIAVYASGIYDLVVEASAFGTAGIFVVVVFGLFSRMGGAPSAIATLVVGMIVWLIGNYALALEYSYVTSLAAAMVTYLSVTYFIRLSGASEPTASS